MNANAAIRFAQARPLIAVLAILTIAIGAGGCSDSTLEEATGKGRVRGVHAIAGHADVTFRIEEFSLGSVAYKNSSTTAPYDNLSYVFNFDLLVPGEQSPRRLASRSLDLVADTDYTFVLAGTPGNEQVLLWERPEREWAGDESVFDLVVGHANTSAGPVDVYLAADGTLPVAGNAIGTLGFGEQLKAREFEAGEYEVILTPAGDPSTLLYRGSTATFPAADSITLVVYDADANITAPVALRLLVAGGASVEIPDERFPGTAQFVNTSVESGPVDVIVNGDFAAPAASNLGVGEVSGDIPVPGTASYQFVPTGTTMALLEQDLVIVRGSRSSVLLSGDSDSLSVLRIAAVRRAAATSARLRLTNAVTDTESINLYILPPGTEIDDTTVPAAAGINEGFTAAVDRPSGDVEITVTSEDRSTTLVGPVTVSLSNGSVFDLFILDTTDPNVAQLRILTY